MKKNYAPKDKGGIIIRGCGVKGCCPTLKMRNNFIIITDDDGNTVKITKKQWEILAKESVKI